MENIKNVDLTDDTVWIDTKGIMKVMEMSYSTLYRKINECDDGEITTKDGSKFFTKKVGNSRLFGIPKEKLEEQDIPIDDIDIPNGTQSTVVVNEPIDGKYTKKLEEENEFLRLQVKTLQSEISETRKRTDTIIMNFSGKLLQENNKPFWKRWFS